jgi:hypothetical protein
MNRGIREKPADTGLVNHHLDPFDLARVRLRQFLAAVLWLRSNDPGDVQ